jgi:hypothetical protein
MVAYARAEGWGMGAENRKWGIGVVRETRRGMIWIGMVGMLFSLWFGEA